MGRKKLTQEDKERKRLSDHNHHFSFMKTYYEDVFNELSVNLFRCASVVEEMLRLEKEVNNLDIYRKKHAVDMKVPISESDKIFALELHLDLVRNNLKKLKKIEQDYKVNFGDLREIDKKRWGL